MINEHGEQLTDKELYAALKKTAPIGDLLFFLNATKSYPTIQADARELLERAFVGSKLTMNRKAFYVALCIIQDRWRREANARERIERAESTATVAA